MKRPWSDSRLARYECAWRGQQIDLDRPEPEGDPAVVGKIVHKAASDRVRWMAGMVVDEPEIEPLARPFVARLDRILKREKIQQTFVGSEMKSAIDEDGVDHPFDGEGAFFRGILDLVLQSDRLVTVYDYKSGWGSDEVTEETAIGRQLLGYGALLMNRMNMSNVQQIRLVVAFLRWGLIREITLSMEEVKQAWDELRARILRAEDRLARDGFEASPGSACNYCHLIGVCPKRTDVVARGVISVTTQSEAEAAAAMVYHTEAAVRTMKDTLRNWTDLNGPISFGDRQMGHFATNEPSPDYAIAELTEVMDRAGFPRSIYLTAGRTRVESIRKAAARGRRTVMIEGRQWPVTEALAARLEAIALDPGAKPTFRTRKMG